jgi:hypothetical protein
MNQSILRVSDCLGKAALGLMQDTATKYGLI